MTRRDAGLGLLGLLRLLGATAEALDLTAGIDDALRPGEERMAHRAHLGLQLRERGAGGEGVAAQAMHFSVDVVDGMDRSFHGAPWFTRKGRPDDTTPVSASIQGHRHGPREVAV